MTKKQAREERDDLKDENGDSKFSYQSVVGHPGSPNRHFDSSSYSVQEVGNQRLSEMVLFRVLSAQDRAYSKNGAFACPNSHFCGEKELIGFEGSYLWERPCFKKNKTE